MFIVAIATLHSSSLILVGESITQQFPITSITNHFLITSITNHFRRYFHSGMKLCLAVANGIHSQVKAEFAGYTGKNSRRMNHDRQRHSTLHWLR